jgi:sec-independent protein translocase protein TatB
VFGITTPEFLALAVLALLVLGPDKLPRFAADAGRFVRTLRRMAFEARSDVRDALGPEFRDISLSDLEPRRFVRRHVFDGDDDYGLDDYGLDDNGDEGRKPPVRPGERPPYDTEAT